MIKKILNKRALCVALIIAAVLGVSCAALLMGGGRYTLYANYNPAYECESAQVYFGEGGKKNESDIIKVDSVEILNGYAKAKIKAVSNGDEYVVLKTFSKNAEGTETNVAVTPVKVRLNNIIVNNIYSHIYIVISVAAFIIAFYYACCFVSAKKTRRYSYDTLFCLSVVMFLSLLILLWGSSSVYSFIQYHTTSSAMVYSVNQNLMTFLTIATIPLMLVFVVSLCVSNLALIKKEGFRPSNSLGIAASAVMLTGLAAILVLYKIKGNYENKILSVGYDVVCALYVLFLVELTGIIAYGIYVSKYTPEYDKDYIIILGCKIKDDGTLYPLIRGRADRAIEFYKAQLEKTGKAACFVPSGGQGSDEIMAEGEAMKNYLIKQGIPEDRIFAETKSATTKENMKFSKDIIDSKTENAKVAFSTTSYHVFRSGTIAYYSGISADGIGSRTKWYFWPNAFLREVAGVFVNHPKKQLVIILLIALSAGLGSFVYSLF